MPAPLVAAAAVKPVSQVAEQALKALTTDLYVVRRVREAGTKKKPVLEETQLHVNALGLAIAGGIAIGGALVAAVLAVTARDRTTSKIGGFGSYSTPGWYDSFNRTSAEQGWVREPGQLFYHRPKKED